MSDKIRPETNSPIRNFIEKRDWRFYVALAAGITLAGTGVFLLSSNNNDFKQRRNDDILNGNNQQTEDYTVEMYESMTDAIISVMSAEQRLAASNQLKLLGNAAFKSKKYEEAIRFYSQAIRFKADPIFYSNRAASYANLGIYDKVLEDCNEALLLSPTYTKALYRRGQGFERKGDLYNALFDFTAVSILDEFKNENARIAMERVLKRISELKATELIKTRKPRLPSLTFVTAYLESFHPDTNNGIPSITDEESGDAYYAKARRSLAEKNYYQAMEDCEKAVLLGCSKQYEAQALNLKGTMAFLKGDAQVALDCFNRSVIIDPSYVQIYIKLASLFMERHDITAALEQFDLAISLNPNDPDIYYHRGQVRYITGNFKEAMNDYEKGIELDPSFPYSQIQLAVVQYQLKMTASAMRTFEDTVKKFPLSSDVHNYYGELLADQGNLNVAVDMFSKAMSLDPNNPLPYINKAMLMYQSFNNVEEAINLCKSALEADPACDAAVASLGQMLLEQDRPTEALVYYEKAIDLARTLAEVEHAISYVEATKVQIRFAEEYPNATTKLPTLK